MFSFLVILAKHYKSAVLNVPVSGTEVKKNYKWISVVINFSFKQVTVYMVAVGSCKDSVCNFA